MPSSVNKWSPDLASPRMVFVTQYILEKTKPPTSSSFKQMLTLPRVVSIFVVSIFKEIHLNKSKYFLLTNAMAMATGNDDKTK